MMKNTVLNFSDFLKEENIICDLPAMGRDEVIAQLVVRLLQKEGGFGKEEAIAAVIERETVSPTVIAPGFALPHTRLDSVEAPIVAVATSGKGIDFLAEGEEPVNVVILILTPKSDPGAYLRVVAAITKTLGAPRMRQRLAMSTSSAESFQILTEGVGTLPAFLTAGDMMDTRPLTLDEGDTLAKAIESFCIHRVQDIPIVDSEDSLRGVISVEDIFRLSLPEHLLWMEDLSSIVHFEPFADLLRKDEETKIADFMRETYVSIHPDTPAIQLAKMFLMNDVRQIQVIHGSCFVGVVNGHGFMAQLFWA